MADAQPSRARFAAALATFVVGVGAAAAVSSCQLANCDPSSDNFGRTPDQGQLVDPDTWESNRVDEPWLEFPRQRSWHFEPIALGDRTPQVVIPYISARSNPIREANNFTIGAGNLAQIAFVGRGRVTVQNNTCADYYLRVVVIVAPRPPEPSNDGGPSDAGSPDGGTQDASADAEAGTPP